MKGNHIFNILVLMIAVVTNLNAQIIKVIPPQSNIRQYQKAEFDIHLKAEWDNPYNFNQVALDMEVTTPSGKKLVQPCFYYSGESKNESLWKARFTPREAGAYQYVFVLSENNHVKNKSDINEFSCLSSSKKGFLQPNDLWSFKYDNGEIFRGLGENICWEARANDDSKYFKELHENSKFNYKDMLSNLVASGGNFFRTWMIYWNLPVDWKTTRNSNRYQNSTQRFNESGIERMDEFINICDSLGIHVMLALESHAGYLGHGWEINNYNVKNGGFAETPTEFFSLSNAREHYKEKLRFMIARWGYSPAIGAWEFFNEIDNAMYAGGEENRIPDSLITDWHREMSGYLKMNDPYNHIVTTSISHRDVKGLNEIESIDLNQKHIYRNTGIIPAVINEYTDKYNKPYTIGEFGYEWDWQKNFNDFAEEMDGDFKRGLWYGLFSPTPVLPMSWWWEFFDMRDMTKYFNNVKEISANMINSGKGNFEQITITNSNSDVISYGVKCGAKYFVYLYNPKQDGITTDIKIEKNNFVYDNIQIYDCDAGKYSEMKDNSKKGVLNDIKLHGKKDYVIIINQ